MSITNHTILGVRIDSGSIEDFLLKISTFLESDDGRQEMICTPNPEILVRAAEDRYYQQILNQGAINLCDGVGIVLISKLLYPRSTPLQRITGTDFLENLCSLAAEKGKSVYFLGSNDQQVVWQTAEYFKRTYPSLRVAGIHPGIPMEFKRPQDKGGGGNHTLTFNTYEHDELIHDIIMRAPDILIVAFGHEKQEKWLYEQLHHMPSVRVAIGVGGAFDFYAGKLRRAPRLVRWFGLEWLWRLFLQPARLSRILTATCVFPLRAIVEKIKKHP